MNVQFAELTKELARSIDRLDAVQTQTAPPGKWGIQQIVEHLTLTYQSTGKILAERLEKGRPTRTEPSFRHRCMTILVLNVGYFPSGRRAPDAVMPHDGSPPKTGPELLALVEEHLWELDGRLNETASQFGQHTRSVSHLILGPLSPLEWRRFHMVHGRHHIRQIDEIRRGMGLSG